MITLSEVETVSSEGFNVMGQSHAVCSFSASTVFDEIVTGRATHLRQQFDAVELMITGSSGL